MRVKGSERETEWVKIKRDERNGRKKKKKRKRKRGFYNLKNKLLYIINNINENNSSNI